MNSIAQSASYLQARSDPCECGLFKRLPCLVPVQSQDLTADQDFLGGAVNTSGKNFSSCKSLCGNQGTSEGTCRLLSNKLRRFTSLFIGKKHSDHITGQLRIVVIGTGSMNQPRNDQLRTAATPGLSSLIQLVTQAQRTPGRHFSVSLEIRLKRMQFRAQRDPAKPEPGSQRVGAGAPDEIQATAEPAWTLRKETSDQTVELWTIKSADTALIQSLLSQESLDASEPESELDQANGSNHNLFAHGEGTQGPRGHIAPDAAPNQHRTSGTSQTPAPLVLMGNLSEMDLPSVLQSVAMCGMAGKLSIQHAGTSAEIYFEHGELVPRTFQPRHLR